MKIPEAWAVYLPRPSTARLKIPPHITEVQRPQSTRNIALAGTSAIEKPSAALYAGIEIRMLAGRRIAMAIRTMAVIDTTMSCTRLDTLPEMTLDTRRPTSMRSQ